jgi:hypothetical protein
MEKPFRIGPFLQFCRLLTALSFFLIPPGLWALSGNEEPLTVLVETSADTPVQGNPWTVTVLVDFGDPKGVTVESQNLPSAFVVERVRTAPRLVSDAGGNETTWTAVEYLLIPQEEGSFTVGPFRVSAGGREVFTSPVDVRVSPSPSAPARVMKPLLRWIQVPGSFQVAQPSLLYLAVENLPPSEAKGLGSPEFVVPENALMEYVPAKNYSAGGTMVLCFRIIPLTSVPIKLESLKVPLGNGILFAPRLTLPSSSEAPHNRADEKPTTVPTLPRAPETTVASPAPKPGSSPLPPFPPMLDSSVPSFFRPAYQRVLEQAKGIWNAGDPVGALAWVRRAERDRAVGPFLRPQRGAMERALGLRATGNERWVPLGLLVPLGGGSFVLGLLGVLTLRAAKKRQRDTRGVTFSISYGYILTVFFLALGSMVFAYGALQRFPALGLEWGGVSALTRSTVVYRVPDQNSVPSGRFTDGQVVRVLSSAEPWAYVENPDGGAGWVPENRLVRY